MAGGKQPLKLIMHKGKKNLTKAEIAKREAEEIDAPADNIQPSDMLPKDLHEPFNRISGELIRIGIMSNLDVDALERYLMAKKLYDSITLELLETPHTIKTETFEEGSEEAIIDVEENEVYTKLLNNQTKLAKQCREAASDLGLTIASRCRLVVPQGKDDKPKDPRESKFGSV